MCYTIEQAGHPFHSLAANDDDHGVRMEDPDLDASVSDSESCVSGPASVSCGRPDLFKCGLVMLDEEEDRVHSVIRDRFVSCLGEYLRPRTSVVAVHRKNWCGSASSMAKVQAFQIHRRCMEREGFGNLKFAWFGTSKHGVERILNHGFGISELKQNDGMYGHGVYLSADDSPFESVQSADVDEDGLRHVVLCRVLLGKTEVVHPYSDQTHPTSEDFHSGVDSLQSPKRYIIWSTNMNTHILPEYVVSFGAPLNLRNVDGENVKKPSSPWMPFPDLIHELAKFLPLQSVVMIYKHYRSHRQKRVSRIQLIQLVRQVAGDDLLMEVIQSWRSKNPRAPLKRGLAEQVRVGGFEGQKL